ncbi:hypothetical protein A2625_02025 [candidate division WOR-1 bacterium RIFCSPHIGHO2_01_FULL_53_15]|uniref:Heme chaperone HemW n=1 Tax=candidate division WOR-1 bacterium RIFCSPHIGHO2_01_FULL_53_15 TaxID=1802564 RepID=A0A1F4PYQ2_UNCSA|nr:MAG: hypothetical protein A2625_02025 [candidate division WOR-1 bacterium RIFCSPHIGHO2_01_FULL_53_15]OGC10681.1 MAG: hypothetical protein A3D23_00715 [candidate division WOR-1 bacterium RIFCSPHIGHO2_02_FULL_53_26]
MTSSILHTPYPIPQSLYIHIPFCKRKCNYCDFVSYAGKEELIDEYVEALCNEINSPPCQSETNPPPSLFKRGGKEGGEFSTIYFGGGTPTLLKPEHYERLLGFLKMIIIFKKETEISMESNPGTINLDYLKEIRSLGINRLSIGVQSFNDVHLKTLGRIHNSKEAVQAYKDARAAGFENMNLDLMYALPGQTLEEWRTDLRQALSLNPEHLSIYNLQVEENTPFWNIFKTYIPQTSYPLPNEETELAMYEFTIKTLTDAGYHHYEISNFAKPGFECKHNINYWKNGNYIGFGAAAHSHLNGKRWANPDSLEEYIGSGSVVRNVEHPTSIDSSRATDRQDSIFLGLRLLEGLPKAKFAGFEKEIGELMRDGLLEEKNSNYKLTRQGLFLGNLVFEKFV